MFLQKSTMQLFFKKSCPNYKKKSRWIMEIHSLISNRIKLLKPLSNISSYFHLTIMFSTYKVWGLCSTEINMWLSSPWDSLWFSYKSFQSKVDSWILVSQDGVKGEHTSVGRKYQYENSTKYREASYIIFHPDASPRSVV